jgi:ribonuclease P protein component
MEFDRVYRHGRSTASRYLVLYVFPREGDPGAESGDTGTKDQDKRLGVSVGRRVGSAVVRNRVKRLLREGFWSLEDRLGAGHDYVVVARPDASELAEREGEQGFERELGGLLERLSSPEPE